MIALPLYDNPSEFMTTPVKTKTRICPVCHGAGLKDGMRCTACAGKGETPHTPQPK